MTWTEGSWGGSLSCKAFALQQAISADSTTKHIVPYVAPWPRLFTLPLSAFLANVKQKSWLLAVVQLQQYRVHNNALYSVLYDVSAYETRSKF